MNILRVWLVRVLTALLRWLEPPVSEVTLRVPVDGVLERARALTREWDARQPAAGFGEMKRHQVLARLMKEFPEASQRAIALAIEAALT